MSANPYAPPLVIVEDDFRHAAAKESARLLELSGGRRVDELGVSLVLKADQDGARWMKFIKWMLVLQLVVGIGGLAGGGLLGAAIQMFPNRWPNAVAMPIALVGVCFCIGGVATMLSGVLLVRHLVRRAIGDRARLVDRHSDVSAPLCVNVEDARTFKQRKLLPEDLALTAFDAVGRHLICEGVRFRYFIYAADVIAARPVEGITTTGMEITFRVGRERLGLTLSCDSLWREFKKQTIRRGEDPLLRPILATLGSTD